MEKKETTYPKATLCDTTYIPEYKEYRRIVRKTTASRKPKIPMIIGTTFPRDAPWSTKISFLIWNTANKPNFRVCLLVLAVYGTEHVR